MHVRTVLKSLSVVAAVGIALAVTGQAADAATGVIATPKKLSVDQSYENVAVSIAGVAPNESCSVRLENVATRDFVASDYLMDGVSTATLKAYDWMVKPGAHQVIAECTDYDAFVDTVVSTAIVIKFRGFVTSKAVRSGAYVTLSGKATRYSPLSLNDRSPVPATNLVLQKRVSGVWKAVKFPKTTSTGAYAVKIYSPRAAYWRVVLPETGKAWGSAAAPVLR